jgi:hypothetical protein
VIEEEIAKFRERESSPYSAGTKTNLFTLLIMRKAGSPAPGAADPVDVVLQYLLGRRPGRIITLAVSPGAKTEAWVSGRCFPDKRNRGVCLEEVRIESGADGLGEDPGAWAPLLIRDLPVFAWMPDGLPAPGEPWEGSLHAANGLVDRLLVDSSRSFGGSVEEPRRTLRALGLLQARTAGTLQLSDFAWRRTRVLREQTARGFDRAEMRSLLPSLTGLHMIGGSPSEALLFRHWMQARLGRRLDFEHKASGPLAEGFRITFSFQSAPSVDIGCTRGGCLERGEEKGAYRFPTDGEILIDEMDSLVRDTVFLEALEDARKTD